MIRLQKYIADCQVASRRKAEEMIAGGRVRINGAVVRDMGLKVTDADRVEVDGRLITPAADKVYVMLHKPGGYVTTVRDQFGRPDVMSLVAGVPGRLFPVGRLDYNTSGLLIMTNDGELAHKLMHPSHTVEKVYIARVKGRVDDEGLRLLREGLLIDGKKTAPAKAVIVKEREGSVSVKITIHEGRNRQVRKMLDAIGCKVLTLKRVATGRLSLGDLTEGRYRHLTPGEVAYLQKL